MKNKTKIGFLLIVLFLAFSVEGYTQEKSFLGKTQNEQRYTFIKLENKPKYRIEKAGPETIIDSLKLTDTSRLSKNKLIKEMYQSSYDSNNVTLFILEQIKEVTKNFVIIIKAKRKLFNAEKLEFYLESTSLEQGLIVYGDSLGDSHIIDGDYNCQKEKKKITVKNGKIEKISDIIDNPPPSDIDYLKWILFITNFILIVIIFFVYFSYKNRNNKKATTENQIDNQVENEEEKKPSENDVLVKKIKEIFKIDESRKDLIKQINEKISADIVKAKSDKEHELINNLKNKYGLKQNQENDLKKIVESIIQNKLKSQKEELEQLKVVIENETSKLNTQIATYKENNNTLDKELKESNKTNEALSQELNNLKAENSERIKIASTINQIFLEYLKELNKEGVTEEEKPKIAVEYLLKISLHQVSFYRTIEGRNTKDDEMNLQLLLGEKPSGISKVSINSTPNESDALTRSIILLLKQNNISILDGVLVRGKKISD